MREVELTIGSGDLSCYGSNDLSWCCCSPIKKDGTISIPTGSGFTTCRELLNSTIRRLVYDNGVKGSGVSFNKTRLVAAAVSGGRIAHAQLVNCMTSGLKLVNHYEKKHKWTLTKIYKVNININHKFKHIGQYNPEEERWNGHRVSAYMLIGPKEWMKSSHMTSLYILLLKIGNTRRIKGFKDHDDLIKRYSLSTDNFSSYALKKNLSYTHKHFKKFEKLMENIKEVFKGRTVKSLYAPTYQAGKSSGINSAGWEGIEKLCLGTSVDIDLSKRFEKVCNIKLRN